jgi:hypothetical protein
MLYRRSLFDRIGTYSEKYKLGGDYDHSLRAWIADVRVEMHPEVLACFDVSGVGSKMFHLEFEELRKIQNSYANKLRLAVRLGHTLMRSIHISRVIGLKSIQRLPIAPTLRKAWVFWKR